jgi:hypothetical protein
LEITMPKAVPVFGAMAIIAVCNIMMKQEKTD